MIYDRKHKLLHVVCASKNLVLSFTFKENCVRLDI